MECCGSRSCSRGHAGQQLCVRGGLWVRGGRGVASRCGKARGAVFGQSVPLKMPARHSASVGKLLGCSGLVLHESTWHPSIVSVPQLSSGA